MIKAEKITEWAIHHTKEEIFKNGQAIGCPISPVNTAEDVVNSEQNEERKLFTPLSHPCVGRLDKFPSRPFIAHKTPWQLERPAPLLGQHNEDIYCRRLGYKKEDLEKLKTKGII